VPPPLSAEEIRDVNTRYHDVAADHYDSKWGIDFGEVGQGQVVGKLRKLLGSTALERGFDRSLEVGAGTGYFSLNLLRAGIVRDATCTDISPGMVRTLAANAERLGLTLKSLRADAESLPFGAAGFDLVLGHAVLHHLPDLERAFSEFHRVLKPGGRIVFAGEPSRVGDPTGDLVQHDRPRVLGLVRPVAEAVEHLPPSEPLGHPALRLVGSSDRIQHLGHPTWGSAVHRPLQRPERGRGRTDQVRLSGDRDPERERRGVHAVVGEKVEVAFQRGRAAWVRDSAGEHPQEVRGMVQVVPRSEGRLTRGMADVAGQKHGSSSDQPEPFLDRRGVTVGTVAQGGEDRAEGFEGGEADRQCIHHPFDGRRYGPVASERRHHLG